MVSSLFGGSFGGQNYYSDPYYDNAAYGVPQYGYSGSPYAVSYPQYGYYDVPQYGAVPYSTAYSAYNIYDPYNGGNSYVSRLTSNAFDYGYEEGYIAGRNARQANYGDRYYQDPYVYENGLYDPYSSSIGVNRQYLSDGYDRGYYDALEGGNGYDPAEDGNVDLVSLLLNSVFSFV